jgi:hypothetical protein
VTANNAPAAFPNVKLLVVNGRRTDDRDVLLSFTGSEFAILPKDGGAAMSTVPYRRLVRATYVRGRNPRWDPALAAPPPDLDVGSIFRQSRHWLVLQTRTDYAIFRLDDSNAQRVIETLEQRTGRRVDRPKSDGKQT